MRGLAGQVLIVVLGGCFAPAPPANVPCDPAEPHCPAGQICVAKGGMNVCADQASPVDGNTMPPQDASFEDAPMNTITKTYPATVAECLTPAIPSPMLCRMQVGNQALAVDTVAPTFGSPWHSYLRFEIDTALAGKMITKVELQLVATDTNAAGGPDSGSVFEVSSFSAGTLANGTVPTKLGMLAGTQGSVTSNEAKSWLLPTTIVVTGKPLFLGVYPNNDDGVTYWNTEGAMPPRLVVDAK